MKAWRSGDHFVSLKGPFHWHVEPPDPRFPECYYVADENGTSVVEYLPSRQAAEQLATLLNSIWQEHVELEYVAAVARRGG